MPYCKHCQNIILKASENKEITLWNLYGHWYSGTNPWQKYYSLNDYDSYRSNLWSQNKFPFEYLQHLSNTTWNKFFYSFKEYYDKYKQNSTSSFTSSAPPLHFSIESWVNSIPAQIFIYQVYPPSSLNVGVSPTLKDFIYTPEFNCFTFQTFDKCFYKMLLFLRSFFSFCPSQLLDYQRQYCSKNSKVFEMMDVQDIAIVSPYEYFQAQQYIEEKKKRNSLLFVHLKS